MVAFLVRRTRQAVWVGDKRDEDDAILELARSDEDTDGLSVFEVVSEEERELVVASIACSRKATSAVDLIEVDRAMVEAIAKVSETPSHGTTPMAEVNALHRSLDWSAADLKKLAVELYSARTVPTRYAPAKVKEILLRLDPAKVAEGPAREFVVDFQKAKGV